MLLIAMGEALAGVVAARETLSNLAPYEGESVRWDDLADLRYLLAKAEDDLAGAVAIAERPAGGGSR